MRTVIISARSLQLPSCMYYYNCNPFHLELKFKRKKSTTSKSKTYSLGMQREPHEPVTSVITIIIIVTPVIVGVNNNNNIMLSEK